MSIFTESQFYLSVERMRVKAPTRTVLESAPETPSAGCGNREPAGASAEERSHEHGAADPWAPLVFLGGQRPGGRRSQPRPALRHILKPVELRQLRDAVDRASLASRRAAEPDPQGLGYSATEARLESSFMRLLERIWVAYQPIVSVSERSTLGYEALLRCTDLAFPTPNDVLEIAARRHRLLHLGQLIRERAAATLAGLSDKPLLFVNLHPRDLLDPELVDPTSPLTAMASQVVLELSERASLELIDGVQARIRALRGLGFRIALDDLGGGSAALANFALLEPEFVKIDVSLVRDINENPLKQKLVASLRALCRDAGKLIVAVGVETPLERDTLLELGCDLLQGDLFAPPGPAFPQPRF